MTRGSPAENASRAYYDRIAANYDEQVDTLENRLVRECFWQCAEAALPARSRILDFGAGSGIDAQHFAGRGHFVAAYDPSNGMLDQLSRRCADQIRDGFIVPIGGTLVAAAAILAQFDAFDAAFSNFGVFSTVSKLEPIFDLFAEYLRPGGLLLIVVQNPWHPAQLKTAAFWKGLPASAFTGAVRYSSQDLGLIYHHTPTRIIRAAGKDFRVGHRAVAPCRGECFGPRSFFRLIELVRR